MRIGTAGWSIPKELAAFFLAEGTSLSRYSRVLGCVEINSTFYRSHCVSTYERWAASVPEGFRFSVKAPKAITHECGLAPEAVQIRTFLEEIRHLVPKLGPLLFQFPPRQVFEEPVARNFFSLLREEYPEGDVVLEPRHASWFCAEAEDVMKAFRIGRVAADPPPVPEAARTGGDASVAYFRLHGSPRMYYSSYSAEWLKVLASEMSLRSSASEVWCIFDNTASGAAMANALQLMRIVDAEPAVVHLGG